MSESSSLEFPKLGKLRDIPLKGLVGEKVAQRSITASKKFKGKQFSVAISGRKGTSDIPGLREGAGSFFLLRAHDPSVEKEQLLPSPQD